MIVTDTNILVYAFLTQFSTRQAQINKLLTYDPDWVAPPLWKSEFCNALALYMRQKSLPLTTATKVFNEASAFMSGRELTPHYTHVLTLAQQSGRSAYDCKFVALAQQLHAQLITIDKKVVNSFPQTAVSLDNMFVA